MIGENYQRLIIDNGSGSIKAGFAGDLAPSSVFPSIIGRPRIHCIMVGMSAKDAYAGHEAKAKRGVLALKYPIEQGITRNWDDMEYLWCQAFYHELRIDPEECTVLLTERPFNPRANREKTTQIMFETFNIPFLSLSLTSELAAFSSGRISGMVVDSGFGVTHTVPVFNGHAIRHAIQRMDLAGLALTDFMTKILFERGYSFRPGNELSNDIKEKLCYLAHDYNSNVLDEDSELKMNYELPDGQVITVDRERIRCPEPLFQPSMIGLSGPGLQDLVFDSIMKCDYSIRDNLFANIALAGGNTMFPGIGERIKRELSNRTAANTKLTVHSDPERIYSSWKGGAVLASKDCFERMCISKEEYEENGPSIVNKKCF